MTETLLPHNHGEALTQLIANLPTPHEFQTVAELYGLLSDESRLRIFWILCHCEECVINLSSIVGMSSPAVSHHLRQLKSRGLIICHRNGKEVYYKAADTVQVRNLHDSLEILIAISCPRTADHNTRTDV